MASLFWDAHGVLFIDYLEKGKTINSGRYIGQLMRLKNEIGEKRLQMIRAPFFLDLALRARSCALHILLSLFLII